MQFLNSTFCTISSSKICAIVTAGLMTGVLQVVLSTSYATLIYGGKLSPYVSQGIGYALFGALIIASIISLFTSLPGTVGSNQDVTVAIFSIISASIIASMPSDVPLENIFFTVVIAIALTVFLTGLFLFGLGIFRIGGLVRYFPYPVVGGFLAGTGWLLLIGGFSILCGETLLRDLFQPHLLSHWLPTLLFSVIMLLIVQQSKNNYILPGLLLVGFLLFYGIAWLSNITTYVPHPGHSFFVFFPPSIYPSRSASDKFNAFRYRFCPSVSCVVNRHMPATLTT
jgi:SulP family sulfate permease